MNKKNHIVLILSAIILFGCSSASFTERNVIRPIVIGANTPSMAVDLEIVDGDGRPVQSPISASTIRWNEMKRILEIADVDAGTAIKSFAEYCYPNLGNNAIIKSNIVANGYSLVNKKIKFGTDAILSIYANRYNGPLLGLTNTGMCMVFMRNDGMAPKLTDSFVNDVSGGKYQSSYKKAPHIFRHSWLVDVDEQGVSNVITTLPPVDSTPLGKMQKITGKREKI